MRGSAGRGTVDGRGVSQVHTPSHIREGMFCLLICRSGVTEWPSGLNKAARDAVYRLRGWIT